MTVSQTNPGQLHPPEDDDPDHRIIRVDRQRQIEAVQRLVAVGSSSDPANAQRFMHYAKTNAIALDAMWSRIDHDDRILQTVLAVVNAGRTAMIFASHPSSPQEVSSLGGLINHAAGHLATRDVHLAQLLLEPDESLERQAAMAGGFSQLATLTYLQRAISKRTLPPLARWSDDVAVTEHSANEWEPSISVDPTGRAWIGWDTYENGNYDVCLRSITIDRQGLRQRGPRLFVAATPDFEQASGQEL